MRIVSRPSAAVWLTLLACNTAQAASPVTYSFQGLVTASHGGPKPGQAVLITFTVDRDFKPDADGTPGVKASYTGGSASPSGQSPILDVTIDGADAHGWFDAIAVQKNLDGVSGVALTTALPQYGPSLTVAMTTTMRGVVKSVAIPAAVFPELFQSAVFTVYVSPKDTYSGILQAPATGRLAPWQ